MGTVKKVYNKKLDIKTFSDESLMYGLASDISDELRDEINEEIKRRKIKKR